MAISVKRIALIWVIPAVGLSLAAYLAVTTLAARGPEVTIAFNSGSGITVGTKVAHKSVTLGSVTELKLAPDLSHVDASVRMTHDAKPYLTDSTRFWVVRPQVSGGAVSDLTTLISGSYIEMDPGAQGGPSQQTFKALNAPPGFRSDEPGTTFTLLAPTIASLTSGTPVYLSRRTSRGGAGLRNLRSHARGHRSGVHPSPLRQTGPHRLRLGGRHPASQPLGRPPAYASRSPRFRPP